MSNNPVKFPLSMRILHWAMALLLLSLILAGATMVKSLEPWQLTLLFWHKSFGVFAALLVVVRLVIKWRSPTVPLPNDIPAWQGIAARLSHVLLYVLMVAIPVSGLAMQYFGARPISVFELFTIPAAFIPDIRLYGLFREFHGYAVLVLIAVLLLHIGGALHHHFVRKDGVLKSML